MVGTPVVLASVSGGIQVSPERVFSSLRCGMSLNGSGCPPSRESIVVRALFVTGICILVAWVALLPRLRAYRARGHQGDRPWRQSIFWVILGVGGAGVWARAAGPGAGERMLADLAVFLVVASGAEWTAQRVIMARHGHRTGWPHVAITGAGALGWLISMGLLRGSGQVPPVLFAPGTIGAAGLVFVAGALGALPMPRALPSGRETAPYPGRHREPMPTRHLRSVMRGTVTRRALPHDGFAMPVGISTPIGEGGVPPTAPHHGSTHPGALGSSRNGEPERFVMSVEDERGNLPLWRRDPELWSFSGFTKAPHWPHGLRPSFRPSHMLVVGPESAGGATRVLAPAVVMRKGPAVVLSPDSTLASLLARVVTAQGATPYWWDPFGEVPAPDGCVAVHWDPLTSVSDVGHAKKVARDLLDSLVVSGRLGSSIPSVDVAETICAALMVASRISARDAMEVEERLRAEPAWYEEVMLLVRSPDRETAGLGHRLEGAIHEILDGGDERVFDVLRAVADVFAHFRKPADGSTRTLSASRFVFSFADVLFICVSHRRSATAGPAAGMLARHVIQRQAMLSSRGSPLTVVCDEVDSTLPDARLGDHLLDGERSGVLWIGRVERLGVFTERWSDRGAGRILRGWRARLVQDGLSREPVRELTAGIGSYRLIENDSGPYPERVRKGAQRLHASRAGGDAGRHGATLPPHARSDSPAPVLVSDGRAGVAKDWHVDELAVPFEELGTGQARLVVGRSVSGVLEVPDAHEKPWSDVYAAAQQCAEAG